MATVNGIFYPTGTDLHPSAGWWANMATSIAQRIDTAVQTAIASAAGTSAQGDAQTLTSAKAYSDAELAQARQTLETALAQRPTTTAVASTIENAVKPVRDTVTTGRLSPSALEQTIHAEVGERVDPLEDLVSTGRLSEASLSITIETETDRRATALVPALVDDRIAQQPEVTEAAATRAVTVAADPAIAGAIANPTSDTRGEIAKVTVQVREAPLTPYRFGAQTPSLAVDNSEALRDLWAAASTAGSRPPSIHLPEGDWVTHTGNLPLLTGLQLTGAGRTATRLANSSGNPLFSWAGVVSGVNMSALYLDGRSVGHLFNIEGDAGIHASEFRDMFWNQQSSVSRIWNQTGTGPLIQVGWENVTMQRTATSTVIPFYISSRANANSNQMRLVRMNGLDNLNTPFFYAESTMPAAYNSDWKFHGVVGEQNPAGLIHMAAANNITFDTVTDQDVHVAGGYVGNILEIKDNALGLASRNITFRHSTRLGSSMSTPAYEIYCAPTSRSILIDTCNPIPRERAKINSPSSSTTYINTAHSSTTTSAKFPQLEVAPTTRANFAGTPPYGTVIMDDATKRLLVSDGTNWRDAMGTIV